MVRIKGMGIALITPFTDKGDVDFKALRRLVEYQVTSHADFLCILCTTSENPTLTIEERTQIKDLVVPEALLHEQESLRLLFRL